MKRKLYRNSEESEIKKRKNRLRDRREQGRKEKKVIQKKGGSRIRLNKIEKIAK